MEGIKYFDKTVNSIMDIFKTNNILKGALHLVIILYAARIAPTLPPQVLNLFENTYVKLAVFFIILWTAQSSPSTAILLSLAFLVTMNFVNNKPLLEFLENVNIAESTAPTKTMAIEIAKSLIEDSSLKSVQMMGQEEKTSIIQPKVVETAEGQAVIIPSVVIAPIIVQTPDGQSVTVTPEVVYVKEQQEAPQRPQSIMFESPQTQQSAMIVLPKTQQELPLQVAPVDAPMAVMFETPTPEEQSISKCITPRSYDISKVVSYGDSSYSNFGIVG